MVIGTGHMWNYPKHHCTVPLCHSRSIYHVYEMCNAASDRYLSILKFPAPCVPFLGAKLPKRCSPVEGKGDHCQKAKWLVLQATVRLLQRPTMPSFILPSHKHSPSRSSQSCEALQTSLAATGNQAQVCLARFWISASTQAAQPLMSSVRI